MNKKIFLIFLCAIWFFVIFYSSARCQTVEGVFEAYKGAVKNRQYASLSQYATSESVQRGYHIMNDYFRENFLKSFNNNPYTVEYKGDYQAIIYFNEDRGGIANPYILTKEKGAWKIDFVKMKARIVFGEGNRWRWR